MYDLSMDFVPRSVSVSDHWWVLHREFEASGKIKHGIKQCPEVLHPTVRMWDAGNGWRSIELPAVSAP
jgi:hypothetical protein